MRIRPTFLALPVDKWASDANYLKLKDIVASLHAVNDAAERAVKFGGDFTQAMTKSEDARQNILQSVELARRAFPRATRKCFLSIPATCTVEELIEAANYDARRDNV